MFRTNLYHFSWLSNTEKLVQSDLLVCIRTLLVHGILTIDTNPIVLFCLVVYFYLQLVTKLPFTLNNPDALSVFSQRIKIGRPFCIDNEFKKVCTHFVYKLNVAKNERRGGIPCTSDFFLEWGLVKIHLKPSSIFLLTISRRIRVFEICDPIMN